MVTTVSQNPNAIGYASLASVTESVKALTVGGVAPSEETVKDGRYPIQRPFVLVTKTDTALSEAAQGFFDFATAALDPISTSKIEELAMQLKERYTIVIVTHNMQQAARISDDTAFFLLGELVEFGETDHLFAQPECKKTEDYITGRFG